MVKQISALPREQLACVLEQMRSAARIPGLGVAVCVAGELVFSDAYGYRDLERRAHLKPTTGYPIASTTKAITATLIGTLVDERMLSWDVPICQYVPGFRLRDPIASAHCTLRDLFAMRTGLPRHDWVWQGHPLRRADLLDLIANLEPSAGFREKFQYNNLLVTIAGHIAEVVTGKAWEELVQERIFDPLEMGASRFSPPGTNEVTLSYHETRDRKLVPTAIFSSDVTGPSGGSIYSNVEDMSRWAIFNLAARRQRAAGLLRAQTLEQIHQPQSIVGGDRVAPSVNAAYAMGWFIDTYRGHSRISHGGYLYDVSSDISLFPEEDIGIVSFANFGCPVPARVINEGIFDCLCGLGTTSAFSEKLAEYEKKVAALHERYQSTPRQPNAAPSHQISDYAGEYCNPGYGSVVIQSNAGELTYERYRGSGAAILLEHWHYDMWIAKEADGFRIDEPHPFDRTNGLLFASDAAGNISDLYVRFEPATEAIRFRREEAAT